VADNINDGNGNIINPCYLVGYSETYSSTSQTIIGSGNQQNCSYYLSKYVTPKDPSCAECGVGSVYQPPLNGQFYAFSGFAYTYRFLSLSNQSTLADLLSAGQIYCGLTWAQAQTTYPSESTSFLYQYCYTSTYIYNLLSAYGFHSNPLEVMAVTSIGNFQISYALGAMIYEASLLPFGPIITTTSTTTGGEIGTSSASGVIPYANLYFLLVLLLVVYQSF